MVDLGLNLADPVHTSTTVPCQALLCDENAGTVSVLGLCG